MSPARNYQDQNLANSGKQLDKQTFFVWKQTIYSTFILYVYVHRIINSAPETSEIQNPTFEKAPAPPPN